MDGISAYNRFLSLHRPQLQSSAIPEHFWPVLYRKLTDQIFDAGDIFSLLLIDYEEEKKSYEPTWSVQVIKEDGIDHHDSSHIYLVDHAWTFRIEIARQQLRQVPGLLQRMYNLIDGGQSTYPENDERDMVDFVFDNIWKYAQSYALNTQNISAEDSVPIWYIMDELGSGIQHSDEPNFRTVPFIYLPDETTYTLLFPIKSVGENETVFRNNVEGNFEDCKQREASLVPWQGYDHFNEDFKQVEPSTEYFLSGHVEETLPNMNCRVTELREPGAKYKVFSQYERINENLTNAAFEIVNDEASAEILWFTGHFKAYKDFSELAPHKFVNQFPFENVITIKDLLSAVARRKSKKLVDDDTLQTYPSWLPTTFNLKTELVKFVSYYKKRELLELDNFWICKPFNLARGLDTHISQNINFITQLSMTGPKIAQKYIERPVVFHRPECDGKVKFDVRYVILLKSVQPLSLYIYKNFFLRFANKPFAMNNFDEYEQHFTVMNYNENTTLCKMLCADYIVEWSNQYPDFPWSNVEGDILKMIRELFECATEKSPPCGIGANPQSRALYAADIMLAWEKNESGEDIIQPKLLEVNWMPDCNRACQYYPDFYNDIFSLFFLDEVPVTCQEVS